MIPGKVIVAEMISFAGLGDASGGTDGSVTVVTFVTVDVTFAVVVAGRLPFEIEPVGRYKSRENVKTCLVGTKLKETDV